MTCTRTIISRYPNKMSDHSKTNTTMINSTLLNEDNQLPEELTKKYGKPMPYIRTGGATGLANLLNPPI